VAVSPLGPTTDPNRQAPLRCPPGSMLPRGIPRLVAASVKTVLLSYHRFIGELW